MTTLRMVRWSPHSTAVPISLDELHSADPNEWTWIDAETSDREQLVLIAERFGLDRLAMVDAVDDVDLSKVDDFGDNMLIVLHGLSESSDEEVETYEVDMFLTNNMLITVRSGKSRSVDLLWHDVQRNVEFTDCSPDVVAARIASVMMRRWGSIVSSFEEQIDELIERALVADRDVLRDVTFLRTELSTIRGTLRPQVESLAELRNSTSSLLSTRGQRRFSDAFDSSTRIDHAIEGVRSELFTALDAYRGAEARAATEINKVLTIYAAILLPLSFVAGFFGMNVPNLPGSESESAWIWILLGMAVMSIVSLLLFARARWITLPRPAGPSEVGRRVLAHSRRPLDFGRTIFVPLGEAAPRRRSSDRAPAEVTDEPSN
ncbi:MAG: magnesium transporter CorA family protein [Acidimicrobiia bacterium]|nr:magnesium transporter CorA family protein [Acidimicrobiia bacterium]